LSDIYKKNKHIFVIQTKIVAIPATSIENNTKSYKIRMKSLDRKRGKTENEKSFQTISELFAIVHHDCQCVYHYSGNGWRRVFRQIR
jgi:hypothetical protein